MCAWMISRRLKKESSYQRKHTIKWLAKNQNRKAVKPLIAMLPEWKSDVQIEAVRALGQIGDARAIEALIEFCNTLYDFSSLWEEVLKVLAEFGDAAIISLILAAHYEDSANRQVAAKILHELGVIQINSKAKYEVETTELSLLLCNHPGNQWNVEQIAHDSCQYQGICPKCKNIEITWSTHEWEKWQVVADSCKKKRTCSRCQATEEITSPHMWGEWQHIASGSCEQQRKCSRCQIVEKGTKKVHVWSEHHYVTDGSCEIQDICSRCKTIMKSTRISHTWIRGEYDSKHPCWRTDTCSRCGARKNIADNHDWEYREIGDTNLPPRCKRCGKV